jgi:hypothetical protein
MNKIEKIIKDIIEDRVDPGTLDTIVLEQVVDHFQEIAQSLVDGEHHDAALAMLEALGEKVDDRMEALDMSAFDKEIAAAEHRGSTYWEFETYTLH